MTPTPDPALTELRLAHSVRLYERVKLGLLIVTVVLNLVIGAYLIGVAHDNKSSLLILRCAVDRTVQIDSKGHPRTPEQARTVFDACVRNHGPVSGTP